MIKDNGKTQEELDVDKLVKKPEPVVNEEATDESVDIEVIQSRRSQRDGPRG